MCIHTSAEWCGRKENRDNSRKKKTIVNSQSNASKFLWGEAMMTATYLVNQLPTPILEGISPTKLLPEFFPNVRLKNNLPPIIFGCECYVLLNPVQTNPLDLFKRVYWVITHKKDINEITLLGKNSHKKRCNEGNFFYPKADRKTSNEKTDQDMTITNQAPLHPTITCMCKLILHSEEPP